MSRVLDASALLALLHKEPGSALVEQVLDGAPVPTVNWAEVAQRSLCRGGADVSRAEGGVLAAWRSVRALYAGSGRAGRAAVGENTSTRVVLGGPCLPRPSHGPGGLYPDSGSRLGGTGFRPVYRTHPLTEFGGTTSRQIKFVKCESRNLPFFSLPPRQRIYLTCLVSLFFNRLERTETGRDYYIVRFG